MKKGGNVVRKKIFALLTAFVFLSAMGASALAAPMFQERPASYDLNNSKGYYIWQDGSSWQVRGVNDDAQHSFTGTVETSGEFSDIKIMPSEKSRKSSISASEDKIDFGFYSEEKADGFSFTLPENQIATFTLYLDGQPADPMNIFLGRQNRHPDMNSFSSK